MPTTVDFTFTPEVSKNKDLGAQLNHNFSIVNPPPGAIMMYGSATAPTGWLLCDGSAVSRTTYSNLFDIVSTSFGTGDGSTTFNVPDLRQRFPIGLAASGTGSTLGGTGGTIDHTHTSAAHTHTLSAHTHTSAAHTHTVPAHFHGMGTGADLNITASGSHTHTMNGGNNLYAATDGAGTVDLTGGGAAGTGALVNTGSNTHTHAATAFAGSVGLVTGGVNGNIEMTSGSTTPGSTGVPSTDLTGSTTPAATGTANPPFQAVVFIIKT